MKIERCSVSQVNVLQKICIKTFVETFQQYNSAEDMHKFLSDAYDIEKLTQELLDNNSQTYLAYDDAHNVLGFLKVNKDAAQTEKTYPNSLEIQRIYVLKEAKGKGVGSELMMLAERIAKQWQVEYIWLGVWEKNEQAIQFYTAKGFDKVDKHIFMLNKDKQVDYILKKTI